MSAFCFMIFLFFQSLHSGESCLTVLFSYTPLTHELRDILNMSCALQDTQPDSSDSVTYETLGYIISKRTQSHMVRVAELYKSQPDKVYVSDSRIDNATGSLTHDTYISLTWGKIKTIEFQEYRCDVIIRENNSEGNIRVLFSKLQVFTSSNANEKETGKFSEQIRLFKRSADRQNQLVESNLTNLQTDDVRYIENLTNPIIKFLKEDYEINSAIFASMRSRLQNYTKQMNDSIMSSLKRERENKQEVISYVGVQNMNQRAQLLNFSDELKDVLNSVYRKMYIETVVRNDVRWPAGPYSLLKPRTGCPSLENVRPNWIEGYIRLHTESTHMINNDSYSLNSHLATPIKSRENDKNFMNLHFCSLTEEKSENYDWPNGSYCINKLETCKNGFTGGAINIDQEDTNNQGKTMGTVPWNPSVHALQFCCRNDGSPLNFVMLPLSLPFYLYRYGGRCQNVFGMTFTEEYVLIDTEDISNNDKLFPPHADGTIKNVNITLCYYEADSN